MADIRIKDLTKEYDLHTMGLDGVTLTVPDGGMLVLAGAPGAGKSTLLRCMGGLLDITSGELDIGGRRMNDLPPRERDVCLMTEGVMACGGSVYDNISYGLRLRGMRGAETDARVREAAEIVGLSDKLREKVRRLSEADRRRVSVARGVARRASVFLLDEPLFALSEEDALAVAADIRRAHEASGLTFVVAIGTGEHAFLFGGTVAVMREGRVVRAGCERELTEDPRTPFVATFLGPDPAVVFEENGELRGVRASMAEITPTGDRECEVTDAGEGHVSFRPAPGAPALTLPFEGGATVGGTVRVRFSDLLSLRSEERENALLKNSKNDSNV